MAAQLHNMLPFHHGNHIRIADGGEPVGNDNGGAALAQFVQGGLDSLLGDGVQGGGCLIQHQDLRIFQEHPGDGDPLLLAAGEHDSPLADVAVIAVRQLHDLIMYLSTHRRLHDLLVGSVRPAVTDVLPDGAGKHEHILLDHADVPPQAALGHVPDIHPVYLHAAGAHIVESGQQLAEGGFAAAGGTHHRQALAGFNVQVDILQHRHTVAIVKADVLVIHPAFHSGQLPGAGPVFDDGLGAHQLQKAGEAGAAVHILLGKLGQPPDGRDKGGHIQREGHQVDVIHLLLHDQQAAHGDHQHLGNAAGEVHAALEQAHGLVILHLGGLEQGVGVVKLIQLLLLVGEGLCSPDAGDAALDGGVDIGGLFLDLDIGRLHSHPLGQGEPQAQGQHHRQGQGQAPLDGEHHRQGAHNGQGADEDVFRAVMGQLRDLKQVTGDAAHQNAGAVLIIEAAGQVLHMVEHVPPHIRLDQHAHAVAQHGDDVVQPGLHQIGRHHQGHHHEKQGEQLPRQQAVHGGAGHIGKHQVDHRHQQGAAHIQGEELFMPGDIAHEYAQWLLRIVFLHCFT